VGGPAVGAGPVIDPEASLVFQASAATVRHVLVAGRWAKRDGVLVGIDAGRLRNDVDVSARGILERMRALAPVLPPPALPAEIIEEFAAMNFAER